MANNPQSRVANSLHRRPSDLFWREYDRWNEAIVEYYFSPRAYNKPVYLDADDDVIQQIGRLWSHSDEEALEDLQREVIKTFVRFPGQGRLLDRHLDRLFQWKKGGKIERPPFVALLAFFANVAERMKRTGEVRETNYYTPLTKALQLPVTQVNRQFVIRGFADARYFWTELNVWLEEHDGSIGLPTARALDRRVHVGLPLSQALLRESDRQRLRDLFAAYHLRPGERLAPSDMERLMQEWVPGSRLSPLPKKLWNSRETRARIAEIACIELESWDGSFDIPEEQGSNRASLLLVASLTLHPRPRIHLGLTARATGSVPDGPYRLGQSVSHSAKVAFEDISQGIFLDSGLYAGWKDLANPESISFPDLLADSVELLGPDGVGLYRPPRRIAILVRDEDLRRYVEVERAELGTSHILLVHSSLVEQVKSFLQTAARPGFQVLSPEEVEGLPSRWNLFADVQIIWLGETRIVDLMRLVPVSRTHLRLAGGLCLPGRHIWHRMLPPEIRASALESQRARVSLSEVQRITDRHATDMQPEEFEGTTVIPLRGKNLPEGDYQVELLHEGGSTAKGRVLQSTSFRLRSGDTPRPRRLKEEQSIGHYFDSPGQPWPTLSAISLPLEPTALSFTGAVMVGTMMQGQRVTQAGLAHGLPPETLTVQGPFEIEDDSPLPSHINPRGSEEHPCLATGAHYWLLESEGQPGQFRPSLVQGQCKYCWLIKWYRTGLRVKVDRKRLAKPSGSPQPIHGNLQPPREVLPMPDRHQSDMEIMLDALSYLGAGTWEDFCRLADQIDDSPWFAAMMSRLLSSLGYIDIVLDTETLRPTEWAVSPSTLTELQVPHTAVMTGFRCESLVNQSSCIVEELGGRLYVGINANSPATIRVEGLSSDECRHVCDSVTVPNGQRLKWAPSPVYKILDALANIRTISSALPGYTPPLGVRADSFDFTTNKWTETGELTIPGAYRFRTRPVVYAFMKEKGHGFRRCDSHLVKHLANQSGIEKGLPAFGLCSVRAEKPDIGGVALQRNL